MKPLRYFAYPATHILAFALFAWLVWKNVPLLYATYAAVFLGIAIIAMLEWHMPYRKAWRPSLKEFLNDAAYALIVQSLLPRLLTIAVALLLASQIEYASAIWPHHLPIGVQALLMMLAADFLRYWLHVASHRWPALWRLHEVHHSPERLYWLNTSRFHPLEKAIQFLFDALPFILLGVSAEVLAIYFVFYAINGFYQHANIDVELGPLNHLISGPQLHRWHHSKRIAESNANYGNNLIVWDLLFGTRYLPATQEVDQLGILKPDYPDGLLKQLSAPFQRAR